MKAQDLRHRFVWSATGLVPDNVVYMDVLLAPSNLVEIRRRQRDGVERHHIDRGFTALGGVFKTFSDVGSDGLI